MDSISKIIARCGGAHIPTLEKCPAETSKYVAVGITILFTGIFAAFSGGYAFYKVFNKEIKNANGQIEDTFFYGSILMGLLWGFMIFNLDRFIVISMKKQNNFKKELLIATPRIILAIIISLVVAKPLEVRLFQDRITAQISDNELKKREQNRSRIYVLTNKGEIDNEKNSNEASISKLEEELSLDCPTKDCKEAYKAYQIELNKYNTVQKEVQPLINDARENIRFIKNSDKYSYTTTVDGVEKQELTPTGVAELAKYNGILSRNVAKREVQETAYRSKLARYNNLNDQYKARKARELEAAQNKNKELEVQKREADKQTALLEKKSSDAASIAYTNNFVTQIEALGDLTKWKKNVVDEKGKVIEKASNTMWFMNLAIILLFLVIETAPIFVKLISNKGQYDIALEAEETKKESEFIHAANTEIGIAEQKANLQLQALMNNHQAQLGMLQIAIQSWQTKKTAELNSGQLSDEDYKKVMEEILAFDILSDKVKKENPPERRASTFGGTIKNLLKIFSVKESVQ